MKKKLNPPQQTKMKNISFKETQETTTSEWTTACNAKKDVGMTIKDFSLEKKCLRISQNDGCFFKFLNEDRHKLPSFCDITVTVYGRIYHAHKVVLAFGSGYFHSRFSENPELHHVSIDNMEGSTFGHLLNFLYTSEFEVSECQIPALAEAACFLDMMEAVNILAKWAAPTHADEEREVPEEIPDFQNIQTSSGTKCLFCSRTFSYKKSLENHLAKTHRTGCHDEEEQTVVSTSVVTIRRSARQRRVPSKFKIQDSENECVVSEKPSQKTANHDAVTYEEEEEDDENKEENENEQMQQESWKEGQEETFVALEAEEAAEYEDSEKPKEACVAEAQKETEPTFSHAVEEHHQRTEDTSHVFPEGLAPVVIHSTNKKSLQCPKCDKIFDRKGEIYDVISNSVCQSM